MKERIRFIQHRLNTAAQLKACDPRLGAEIDLRSSPERPGRIHLSHDPWALGEDFESWLEVWREQGMAGTLILNTKEDGLEARALELVRNAGVTDFFFLDTAAPTLVRLSQEGLGAHLAVRISSFEPTEGVSAFRGKVAWAWVDCFGGAPVAASVVERLKADFKVCLVSPELQKKPLELISDFRSQYASAYAVCTKAPDAWRKAMS